MASFTRRDFATTLAAAGLGLYVSPGAGAAGGGWFDGPMRWGQLTLVEDDPPKIDIDWWVDYWKRCRIQAITLSAGGIVCYYPTQVPLHYRSRWLGDRDVFGDLVSAARKLDLRVLARIDTHAVHADVFEAHPEWVARNRGGEPVRHWVVPEMYLTSFVGPYHWDYVPQIIREIHARYDVDGIFANRWNQNPPDGICYCAYCRDSFRKFSGAEIPARADAADPAWRQFVRWRERQSLGIWKHWDAASKAARPGGTFMGTYGGGITNPIDWKALAEQTDMLDADNQGRSDFAPAWRNGELGKIMRSVMGAKPIIGIFGTTLATRHRWYLSTKSNAEQKLWMAEGVANGFRPWWTAFGGVPEDQRWMGVVEQFYQWHARHEPYFRNMASLASIGVVYSQRTALWPGGAGGREAPYEHFRGFYHALLHERRPFDLVHEDHLDEAHVSRFRLLVLPNIALLSDRQCEQLRRFVERGGSLAATHETSLYDEDGRPRADFGLADVFGVSLKARANGPLKNSYLRIEPGEHQHPLLAGLEDTPLVVNSISNIGVEARPGVERLLWVIPPFPDLPMEKVFTNVRKTGQALAYLRQAEAGAGRVVYLAGDLDRTYWEVLAADHRRLLGNAVRWALGDDAARGGEVRVSGPGFIDVTAYRQSRSLTVHLVNLTNHMMWKGPVEEFIPVGEQQVEVDLPANAALAGVKLLARGEPARFTRRGRRLAITVPALLDYEVVAIDLA